MKTLVTYISQTGNTKKVAEAIYAAVMEKKEIKELSQINSLDGYDLVFVGFPIVKYGPIPEAADFLGKQASGKNVALFITHAAPEEAETVQAWLDNCKAVASKTKLKGLFNCQGKLGEQIATYMLKSGNPELSAWAAQRPSTLGQPDAARLKKAQIWAKKMTNS
jgi:flavodoxin